MDTADDVIAAIGEHSGVSPLSWHRLRHTWAERMAEAFADQPNGMDRLVYLGGWTNPQSATRYIQRALQARRRTLFATTIAGCTGRRRMLNAGRVSRLSDLPPLHTTVLSFDGQLVDTTQEVWRFRSSLDGGKRLRCTGNGRTNRAFSVHVHGIC